MKKIKEHRIFYRPPLRVYFEIHWHKILITAIFLMIIGKILAHGFRVVV